MDKGKILILVGGSSAGKTSLGKALQEQMDELYLLMGIDLFWFTLQPDELDLQTVKPEYYSWTIEQRDGKQFFRIIPGPILDRLMNARYPAIATFLDRGFNVVADEVIWKRDWLLECLNALSGYEAYFIKVFCSDEVGAQRETDRGDRYPGWNRGSAYYSDLDCLYDLEIDTTEASPDACAQKIKAALAAGLKPTAFGRMREKFSTSIAVSTAES